MEAMTSFSLSRPKSTAGSRLGTAVWTAKMAGLLVVSSAAALLLSYSLLFVLRSSPRSLWLAANLIIFAVWRLSSAAAAASNHRLDDEPPPPIPPPDIGGAWHDIPSSPESEPEMRFYSSSYHEESERGEHEETEDDAVASDDDASMEGTWQAIAQRGAAERATRPVLTKSETWERRLERTEAAAAETGAAVLRKSATCREGRDSRNIYEAAGWRRREALVVAHDELFRQVESFIKKHYDHLKLQRQESELHRRFPEKLLLNSSATFARHGAT